MLRTLALRGVGPGAPLSRGGGNTVLSDETRYLTVARFVEAISLGTGNGATVWSAAPAGLSRNCDTRCPSPAGRGEALFASDRVERRRVDKRFRLHSDPWPAKTRLAAVGCAERWRSKSCSHPRIELRRRATAGVVRGVLDRPRPLLAQRSFAEVDERREACLVRRDPSPSQECLARNMREHPRANKRRKLDRGGKAAGLVAGPNRCFARASSERAFVDERHSEPRRV